MTAPHALARSSGPLRRVRRQWTQRKAKIAMVLLTPNCKVRCWTWVDMLHSLYKQRYLQKNKHVFLPCPGDKKHIKSMVFQYLVVGVVCVFFFFLKDHTSQWFVFISDSVFFFFSVCFQGGLNRLASWSCLNYGSRIEHGESDELITFYHTICPLHCSIGAICVYLPFLVAWHCLNLCLVEAPHFGDQLLQSCQKDYKIQLFSSNRGSAAILSSCSFLGSFKTLLAWKPGFLAQEILEQFHGMLESCNSEVLEMTIFFFSWMDGMFFQLFVFQ